MDTLSKQLLQEWEEAGLPSATIAEYRKRANKAGYDWREVLMMRKIDESAEFIVPVNDTGDPQFGALVFGTPTEMQMDVLPRINTLLSRFIFDEQCPYNIRMEAIRILLDKNKKEPAPAPTNIFNTTNVLEVSDETLMKIIQRGKLVN